MTVNKFNSIFQNPYEKGQARIPATVTPEPAKEDVPKETSNKSLFIKKEDKEKKMFYIKASSIKKIEKIAGKYNLNLSEVLDIIIKDFNKY